MAKPEIQAIIDKMDKKLRETLPPEIVDWAMQPQQWINSEDMSRGVIEGAIVFIARDDDITMKICGHFSPKTCQGLLEFLEETIASNFGPDLWLELIEDCLVRGITRQLFGGPKR